MGRGVKVVFAAFMVTAMHSTAVNAEDIYWVGGTGDKTWNTAENWDLKRNPTWGDTVHITNAVNLSLTSIAADSIRVSGGDVSINTGKDARYFTGNAISSTVEIWVDTARTLTWSGDYLIYGNAAKTFVKSGGGTLTISVGIGNITGSTDNRFKSVEVREGILNHTTKYNALNTSSSVLKIGSSGTYKINNADSTISSGMVVDIAEGGVLDLCNNSNSRTLRGLTGAGEVINNKSGLKLRGEGETAASSGTFSGLLSGPVTIEPQNGNAFIVGAADTLSNCTLNVVWPNSGKTPLKFASGIGTFFVTAIPDIDVHADIDGQPVDFVLPGRHWYVDPSHGTSGDGTSASGAFLTFAEAFAVAESGDTVWAAPGTYATETFTDGDGLACRLCIPAGVKVRASGSADNTIIDGGEVARCVYMNSGSHLAGFTVQNGYATKGSGGGIKTADGDIVAYVVDSVIKNNKAAYRSGEVFGPSLVFYRCRFLGNAQTTAAQGTEKIGSFWSCFVDGYKNNSFWLSSSVGYFRNCTFGENHSASTGALRTNYFKAESYNGIFLQTTSLGSCTPSSNALEYRDCLLGAPSSKTNSIVRCDTECKFSVDKSSILDELFKPLSSGAAVDAGTNEYYPLPSVLSQTYGNRDLAGLPRCMNRSIDIGAYEYDWRAVFGNALAKGLVIEDVSSGVTTNETGLSMGANDRIVMRFGRDGTKAGTYSFLAAVEGEGALHVFDGGTNLIYDIDSSAGGDRYTVETAGRLSLTFVFRGDGTAALSDFTKPRRGMIMIVR